MGHHFKKKYGQNFISDKNILRKIVNFAKIKRDDYVIEIGAGSGNLTEILSEKTKNLFSYEIDKELTSHLKNRFGDRVNFIFDDFMKRNIKEDVGNKSVKIVANLPYNVTTPIIMKLLEEEININTMTIMVQKEVQERFMAKPRTKAYNSLSVILQHYFEIKVAFNVNRKLFYPVPNVDSVVIHLSARKNININKLKFINFVKKAFTQKRKLLKNNLTIDEFHAIEKLLLSKGYRNNVRAEEISVQDFVELSQK